MRPSKVQIHAGEAFDVSVEIRIAPGWHIYAMERPSGSSLPTTVELSLPTVLELAGDWTLPDPAIEIAKSDKPSFVYTGDVLFRRKLRVSTATQPGPLTIRGELKFQACDRFSCRPPDSIPIQTEALVAP